MKRALNNTPHQMDRAVIIDFPGYNFKIALALTALNIPISTFITPNFWLWNQHSLGKKLMAYSDHVITIFQQEFKFYSKINPTKTYYFGHPLLLEPIQQLTPSGPQKTIGIFPGSRTSEINDHLPVMASIISHLPKDYSVQIICNQPRLHPLIHSLFKSKKHSINVCTEITTALDYAITAPGTNSLRLGLMGIPLTIIGQVPFWVYALAKWVMRIKIDHIGLPNVVMNARICPEYIRPSKQECHTIANNIQAFFSDPTVSMLSEHQASDLRQQLCVDPSFYDCLARLIATK
jgi:lipid-A-disaccharide synthase